MNTSNLFLIGKQLIEENETEKGINYLDNAISKGSTEAVNYYCSLLIKGEILNKDIPKAKTILKKFINKNDPTIYLLYGKVLINEENYKEAIKYYKKSSKLGNAEAMYELGILYYEGEKVPRDENQAMKFFNLSKKKGFNKSDAILESQKRENEKQNKTKINRSIIIIICSLIILALFFLLFTAFVKFKQNQKNYLIVNDSMNTVSADQEQTNLLLKQSADNGNMDAMFNFGLHLFEGKGSDKDLPGAAFYFKKSADLGVVESMINYGYMLYGGHGIPANKKEACKYYKMAADSGSPNGMFLYAAMRERGEGEPADLNDAITYYKKAIKKGQPEAMYSYGMILDSGILGKQNFKEANKFFKMAADKGQPLAINRYGLNLFTGTGTKKNLKEALKYFKLGSEKENVDSMYHYSMMILDGHVDSPSEDEKNEALKYLHIAFELNYTNAIHSYAIFLLYGLYVEKNIIKGFNYLKSAADMGNEESIEVYKNLLYDSKLSEIDKEDICYCFKKIADEGDAKAMYVYGVELIRGINVPQNFTEAVRYFKMSSDLNNVDSAFLLALKYYKGDNVETNKTESAIFMKKAADLGNCEAMNLYSMMLEIGVGVDINLEESKKYHQMAIENGYKE